MRAVVARDALDQFGDGGRLVALRLVLGFDHEPHAAFGFFRAGRAMRGPDFELAVVALEFGAAIADQGIQCIRGRGDAERLHLVARRARHCGGVFLLGGEAELFCEFRIERGDGGRGAVIGGREFALGGFVEAGTLCSPPSAKRWGGVGGGGWLGRFGARKRAARGGRGGRFIIALRNGIALRDILAGATRRGPRAVRGGLAA